jgi:histidyl-tRNA synthetase
VGISFGADRIYDVMLQLNKFDAATEASSRVLFANYGEKEAMHCLPLLHKLQQAGIAAELYPDPAKLNKQFSYADSKNIRYLVLIGENEIADNSVTIKNLLSGVQKKIRPEELTELVGNNLL